VGSEPGAGWGVVRELARLGECTVLVAPEHVPAIRAWERENPGSATRFIKVPEPGRPRLWKWHRIPWFLEYLRWLRAARKVGLDLHAEERFDLVVHATYAVYWLPSPCVDFDVPCLWGPVGGAVTTPRDLVELLGWKGRLDDWLDRVGVGFASRWSSTRRTWQRADHVMVQNEETLKALPASVRARSRVVNHAHYVRPSPAERRGGNGSVVWASRFESRKGPRLAVRVLAATPAGVTMTMVGEGSELGSVRRLAERLGVSDRLQTPGPVSRSRLAHLFAGASVALFTGLREEGGLALAEAMSVGVPVVLLGHGGPRDIARITTDASRVVAVEPGPVEGVVEGMRSGVVRFIEDPAKKGTSTLNVRAAREELREAVHALL